jgi:toxin YhaV
MNDGVEGPRARVADNEPQSIEVNGWTLCAHPLFLSQVQTLTMQVAELRRRSSVGIEKKNAAKRLAAITKLIFEVIPQDPTRPEYRQGNTLGPEHKHWFRAKFFQQYRLFFRYHESSKIIVYAWVNDESTKRAYESNSDAYRVFQKMLVTGHPPDSWEQLIVESQSLRSSFPAPTVEDHEGEM